MDPIQQQQMQQQVPVNPQHQGIFPPGMAPAPVAPQPQFGQHIQEPQAQNLQAPQQPQMPQYPQQQVPLQNPHVVQPPPVHVPLPNNNPGGFQPTPQQVIQDAQMQQQQAGVSGNPPVQQQAPQQQQQQEYGIDPAGYEGVNPEVLQGLVQQAYDGKVPQDQLDGYVREQVEYLNRFETVEEAQEYGQAYDELVGGLVNTYGSPERAQAALEGAREGILKHGGEALLERFSTDPGMLSPEILGPYLRDATGAGKNPWEQYVNPQGQQQQVAPQTQQQVPQPGQMAGGLGGMAGQPRSREEIAHQISQMYAPNVDKNSPQWRDQMMALHREQRRAV